ncbi:MAG: hypothetical protein ACXWRU_13915 [Pseudobdellovibrionaceae bacterium]
MTSLTLFFILITGIFRIIVSMFKGEWPRLIKQLIRIGIYCAGLAVVILTITINNKIAENRAEKVLAVVKKFKTKYNHYPDSLQALVPEFLDSVPLAKYSFTYNDFHYSKFFRAKDSKDACKCEVDETNGIEDARLFYIKIPPFGHPTYNFNQGEWDYSD